MSAGTAAVPRPADWLELFEAHALRQPDAPALETADLVLSRAELDRWSGEIAADLRGGEGRDISLVGVYVDRGPLAIAAIMAVLKAGLAYIALDPRYPRERIEYMVADAELAVVLTDESLTVPCPPETVVVRLPGHDGNRRPMSPGQPDPGGRSAELAYVVYTSGSTGRPKGSLITHSGLANMALAQQRFFELGEGDRVLQFSSLSFDASTFELILALASGACLCLAEPVALQPGTPLLTTLAERAITTLVIPPSALAKVPQRALPELRTIAVAGEPCPPGLVQAWGRDRRFLNLYGPSEATIWTTASRCRPGDREPSIGRTIDGIAARVLDPDLNPVAEGDVGELHVGGAGVGLGYLKRARLTAERFIPDERGEPGARLYRTGDMVRVGAEGNFHFVGRRDRQVKVRGFRIDLGEIEAALLRSGMVQQAAVIQDPQDQRLVGYLVPAAGGTVDIPKLRELLRRELPDHMVPGRFIPVPGIPLDPNGKADLRSLPALASRDLAAGAAFVAPEGAAECLVAALIAEALRFDLISRDDDLFKLGGDSLQAPGIITELEAIFDCRLTFEEFVRQPTPRAVAALVEASGGADTGSVASTWLRERRGEEEQPQPASNGAGVTTADPEAAAAASAEAGCIAVRSCHGHHSIWPANRPVPAGWTPVGEPARREECLGLVEATWEGPVLRLRPSEKG